jgi:hypothetical protein
MGKIICDFCKEEPVAVVEISSDGEVIQCCFACYERESETGELY